MKPKRVDENRNVSDLTTMLKIIYQKNIDERGIEEIFCVNKTLTLKDCYEIAMQKGHNNGTIVVIEEKPLFGYVYKYGNNGSYWELIGEVCGYA